MGLKQRPGQAAGRGNVVTIAVVVGLIFTLGNISVLWQINHEKKADTANEKDGAAPVDVHVAEMHEHKQNNADILGGALERAKRQEALVDVVVKNLHSAAEDPHHEEHNEAEPQKEHLQGVDPTHAEHHAHKHAKHGHHGHHGHKGANEDHVETEDPHGHHKHHHHGHNHDANPEETEAEHHGHKNHEHGHHKKHGGHHHHHDEGDDAAPTEAADHDATPRPTDPPVLSRRDQRRLFDSYSLANGKPKFEPKNFVQSMVEYRQFINGNLTELLEQSSNRFKDFYEHPEIGVRLPTGPKQLAQLAKIARKEDGIPGGMEDASLWPQEVVDVLNEHPSMEEEVVTPTAHLAESCDASDADYSNKRDEKCRLYLLDIHNWMSIKAMSSILSTGRTIKFKVFYKHYNLTAVMKVSQKKFALEPASEVEAFTVDRALQILRVPITAWVAFPIPFVQVAASSMGQFYSHWYEKFVLQYSSTRTLQRQDGGKGRYHLPTINISLQVWMNDVHDADETLMNPPINYNRFFKVTRKKSPGELAEEKEDGSHGMVPAVNKMDAPVNWETTSTVKRIAVGELMMEWVFDYVIDNTDRWFGHNSFAVGGCLTSKDDTGRTKEEKKKFYGGSGALTPRCKVPTEKWRQSKLEAPRYAFIDQGSSFYRSNPPDSNPLTKASEKNPNFCRFPKIAARELLKYKADPKNKGEGSKLYDKVKAELDRTSKGIFNVASKRLLKSAGKRAEVLAAFVQSCVDRFGDDEVFFF